LPVAWKCATAASYRCRRYTARGCRSRRPSAPARRRRRVLRIDGARRKEVAVRLLRLGDQLNQLVEPGAQPRIGDQRQRVRRRLDDLEDVRVVEAAPFVRTALLARGLLEIGDAAGVVVLREDVRDVTVRLIASFGAQNPSSMVTAVNGTRGSRRSRNGAAGARVSRAMTKREELHDSPLSLV